MSSQSGSPAKGKIKYVNRVLSRKEVADILKEDERYNRFIEKRRYYKEVEKTSEQELAVLMEKVTALTSEEQKLAYLNRAVNNVRKRLKQLTKELTAQKLVARSSRVRMNRRVTAEGAVLRARISRAQAEIRACNTQVEKRHTELFQQAFNERINGDYRQIPNREEWLGQSDE